MFPENTSGEPRPRTGQILSWIFPPLPIARQLWAWMGFLVVYSLLADFLFHHLKLSTPEWGTEATAIDGLVLGMLVVLRNNASYARWWEARTIWGKLVNDSRNLAIKAHSYVDAPAAELRQFGELIIGFAYSLKLHLRGKPQLTEVPGFEQATERPKHVPNYLAGRVFDWLHRWRQGGQLDNFGCLMLDEHARGLTDATGGSEKIQNTPFTASYAALMRYGIAVYALLAPLYVVQDVGLVAMPALLLALYFLIGVELVAEATEEPFGTTRDDLPIENYCAAIEASVREMLCQAPSDANAESGSPSLSGRG